MDSYEDTPMVPQPESFQTNLFPHQLASIYSMEKLELEQVVEADDDHRKETNLGILADLTGYGKCLKFDTAILLHDGTIEKVQNIKVGDLLMGDDSAPREVLSLARGRENMYTIKQNTGGEDYTVNESHILSLKMSCPKTMTDNKANQRFQVSYFDSQRVAFKVQSFYYSNFKGDKEEVREQAKRFKDSLEVEPRVDIEVREYLKLPRWIQKNLKGYRVGVDFPERPIELDPYMLGLWLGDGCKNNTTITTDDGEIVQYLRSYCEKNDCRLHQGKQSNTTRNDLHYSIRNDGKRLITTLKKYKVYNNKHIPHIYLANSRKNRLSLLAGLIDSDGYYYRGVYEITQKRESLANDIVYLARSLGFRAQAREVSKSCLYKGERRVGSYTRVTISGSRLGDIPTLIERKKAVTYPNKDQLCTGINVVPQGKGDYYGFTLDGNHRFLLGDFTVTHNTASIIGLIIRDQFHWDEDLPHELEITTSEAGGHIKNHRIRRYDKLPTTLILVSPSIVGQWKEELSKSRLVVASITSKNHVDHIDPEEYDVMLVVPSMYNKLIMSHSGMAWKRFIFDEPGHLRVSGMKPVIAGFYWFVTATPEAILLQHRNCRGSFMWNIVHNNPCDFETTFGSLTVRNDSEFVTSSFEMPPTYHTYHKCFQPVVNSVKGFVKDKINTMIEAGNIEGAITALGGSKTDNIVDLVKQKKQEELEVVEAEIKISKIRGSKKRVQEWTDKKVSILGEISEIDKRFSTRLKGDCDICLEKLTCPVLEPGCQNLFCGECLLTWLQEKANCPRCRAEVDTTKLTYIQVPTDTKTPVRPLPDRKKTKEEMITDIVKQNKGKKFLIFSDYDNTFKSIQNILAESGIECAQIRGSLQTRERVLKCYKEGDLPVIFLNSDFNGSGLNLQETTGIILYHEMPPSTLNQLIGRANRIGRQQPLYVYHLQVQG